MDEFGAFCPGERVTLAGEPHGPLAGLSFAAKDNFDVEGHVTGAGNPDWARTHPPATGTASAIRRLLEAGASLAGKTQMDELAWGSIGVNAHYGTPLNPAASDRVPGGSSSGSASAVAAGLVDFALGTDSACSVRLPASFCGIFGFRPTHGRVSLEGVVPLSESLDTVGWFARDAGLLRGVGEVLFDAPLADSTATARLLTAEDAFAAAEPEVVRALEPAVELLTRRFGGRTPVRAIEPGPEQELAWLWFRAWSVESREAWALHGPWIEATKPDSRVLRRETFADAADSTPEDDAAARRVFASLRAELRRTIAAGTILCLPTAAALPPMRDASPPPLRTSFCLLSIAGIGGLPQISIPAGTVDGVPVGLSLVGPANSDEALLALAADLPLQELAS